MGMLSGFISGLAGLFSYWLMGILAGATPPIWSTGKDAFSIYFSLFAFAILFAPVYFMGRAVVFKLGRAFNFCSQDIAYCFLFGLTVHPALMIGDLMISSIEFKVAFSNNAMRFSLLMVIAGIIEFLFCAASYVIFFKIFSRLLKKA